MNDETRDIRIAFYDSRYRMYLNGTVIGSISKKPSRSIKNAIELWCFGIYGEYRGKGYGQHLLQEVIQRNQEKVIILYVHKTNVRAIHIYEKLGFSIAGEYMEGTAWEMRIYPQKKKSC